MDLEKLLTPIAQYFDFCVDFVSFRALSSYVRLGTVSPTLVSFLFIGLLFAFVIKRAKGIPTVGEEISLGRPGIDLVATSNPKSDISRISESSDLLLLILFQVSGTIFLHVALLIASQITPLSIGNFKDSLNVTIAVSSLQYPLQAVLHRLLTFIKKIENYNKATRAIAFCVNLVYLVIVLLQLFYFLHAAATIHGLRFGRLLIPTLILVFFILIVISIAIYFTKIFKKMYVDPFHR